MFKQMFAMKPRDLSFPIAPLVTCDRNYSPAKAPPEPHPVTERVSWDTKISELQK